MAPEPLATVDDLQTRGIDVSETDRVEAFLAAASSEVRSAAGVPITESTFTATIPGSWDRWLPLPGQPVTGVEDVRVDDTPVDDWKFVGGHLWRSAGWSRSFEPSTATVTITGGMDEAPADIVDLVCSLVGLALATAEDGGYASRGDLVGVRVDDASEQYESSSTGQRTAGVMELPRATRSRLAARFGGGAYVVRAR